MSEKLQLHPERIISTIELLEKRIADRFPKSGLREVCGELLDLARNSRRNIAWVSSPHWPLRLLAFSAILVGIAGLIFSITFVELEIDNTTLGNIASVTEALFNDLVLLGAGIFFLVTMESRVKRQRTLKYLHQLRVIAHVIDMHQLTKDPNIVMGKSQSTVHSPKRILSKFELQRYLDYCSEAHALIAKVAALYSQAFPDEGIVRAVNEIEVLTTGLSRKTWQKIMILNEYTGPRDIDLEETPGEIESE